MARTGGSTKYGKNAILVRLGRRCCDSWVAPPMRTKMTKLSVQPERVLLKSCCHKSRIWLFSLQDGHQMVLWVSWMPFQATAIYSGRWDVSLPVYMIRSSKKAQHALAKFISKKPVSVRELFLYTVWDQPSMFGEDVTIALNVCLEAICDGLKSPNFT